jgi:glycosyltransferase involved in cell wall biosynthesis
VNRSYRIVEVLFLVSQSSSSDYDSSKAPSVSFIMATFNSAKFVEEAIKSVLNQSFSNFELIVVDNQSTDKTQEILAQFAVGEPRIRVIHMNPPGKIAAARKVGLDLALGDWVSMIDSDDVIEPEKTYRQLEYINNNKQIVYLGCNALFIDETGKVIGKYSYPENSRSLVRNLNRVKAFPPHSSCFFNRKVALNSGGYNTRMLAAEDLDFQLRMSKAGELGCLPQYLVSIRKHSNNLSAAKNAINDHKYIFLAEVSSRVAASGKIDPSLASDEEWIKFSNFVENSDEFAKSKSRYLQFAIAVESLTRRHSLSKKITSISRFVLTGLVGLDISSGFSQNTLNRVTTKWIKSL